MVQPANTKQIHTHESIKEVILLFGLSIQKMKNIEYN